MKYAMAQVIFFIAVLMAPATIMFLSKVVNLGDKFELYKNSKKEAGSEEGESAEKEEKDDTEEFIFYNQLYITEAQNKTFELFTERRLSRKINGKVLTPPPQCS